MMEFTFQIDKSSECPLYQQLYNYVKCEIESGSIAPGNRLPSSRRLSQHLSVSRNTVETAYSHLAAEGYLQGRSRSGLYVSKEIDHDLITHFKAIKKRPVNTEATKENEMSSYDFRKGCVDLESFPYATWKRLTNRCICPENSELLTYGNHQGELSFRSEMQKYIHHARGVNCSADQIVVTSGTQQSIDLVCKLMRNDHSDIAVEDPGYVAGRVVIKTNGLNPIPIPLDHMGISTDQLYASNAGIVLVTPSHQFPTGMIMPVAKRLALLKWAEDVNGIIIENDYQGEISYKKKSIPCLQHLDQNEHVVYLYSFSGSLLPAAKTSIVVLPPKLLEKYRQEHCMLEQPVSKLQQRVLELFIAGGHWEKHLKRTKKIYGRKHTFLTETANALMGNAVEISGNSAGLHILLKVRNGMNEDQLIASAKTAGVCVYPTSTYRVNPERPDDTLVLLGYGGMNEQNIAEGLQRLNHAWFGDSC